MTNGNEGYLKILFIIIIAIIGLVFLYGILVMPWYIAVNNLPRHPELIESKRSIQPFGVIFSDSPNAAVHHSSSWNNKLTPNQIMDFYRKELPLKGWKIWKSEFTYIYAERNGFLYNKHIDKLMLSFDCAFGSPEKDPKDILVPFRNNDPYCLEEGDHSGRYFDVRISIR
ncbi:MAG: hypothetical protein AABX16_01610 [Nanoarchaeota archaeon]